MGNKSISIGPSMLWLLDKTASQYLPLIPVDHLEVLPEFESIAHHMVELVARGLLPKQPRIEAIPIDTAFAALGGALRPRSGVSLPQISLSRCFGSLSELARKVVEGLLHRCSLLTEHQYVVLDDLSVCQHDSLVGQRQQLIFRYHVFLRRYQFLLILLLSF